MSIRFKASTLSRTLKVVVALLVVLLISLLGYYAYRKGTNAPMKVRITNVSPTSATVSWMTRNQDNGFVIYSDQNDLKPWPTFWIPDDKGLAYDDRDWADAELRAYLKLGQEYTVENVKVTNAGNYYLHHVTLRDLNPESKYYFRVSNGLFSWDIDGVAQVASGTEMPLASIFEISTPKMDEAIGAPDPAYGQVYTFKTDGYVLYDNPSTDSIVYAYGRKVEENLNSLLLSSVTNSVGGWTVDKANFRDEDGVLMTGVFDKGDDFLVTETVYENIGVSGEKFHIWGVQDDPVESEYYNYVDVDSLKAPGDDTSLASQIITKVAAGSTSECINPNERAIAKCNVPNCYCKAKPGGKKEWIDIYEQVGDCRKASVCASNANSGDNQTGICCQSGGEKTWLVGNGAKQPTCDGTVIGVGEKECTGGGGDDNKCYKIVAGNTQVEVACDDPKCEVGPCTNTGQKTCWVSESANSTTIISAVSSNEKPDNPAGNVGKPYKDIGQMSESDCDAKVEGEESKEVVSGCWVQCNGTTVTSADHEDSDADFDSDWRFKEGVSDPECKVAKMQEEDACGDPGLPVNACYVKQVGFDIEDAKWTSSDPDGAATAYNKYEGSLPLPHSVSCTALITSTTTLPPVGKVCCAITSGSFGTTGASTSYEYGDPKVAGEVANGKQCVVSGEVGTITTDVTKCEAVVPPTATGVCCNVPGGANKWYAGKNECSKNLTYPYTNQKETLKTETDCVADPTIACVLKKGGACNGCNAGQEKTMENNDENLLKDSKGEPIQEWVCNSTQNQWETKWKNNADEVNIKQECKDRADVGKCTVITLVDPVSKDRQDVMCDRCTGEGEGCGYYDTLNWFDDSYIQGSTERDCVASVPVEVQDRTVKTEGLVVNVFAQSSIIQAASGSDYLVTFPENGVYSLSFADYSAENIQASSSGRYFFYDERNNQKGYQLPTDPDNPRLDEDLIVKMTGLQVNISKTADTFDIELKKGINIVSFNFYPTNKDVPLTAEQLLQKINAKDMNVTSMTYFKDGAWNGGVVYDPETQTVKGNDFPLVFGQGYLLISLNDVEKGEVKIPGRALESSVPLALKAGWNLVGINGYSENFTAKSLSDSISGVDGLVADNVTRWDTSKSKYEGISVLNGSLYGFDYPIRNDVGYFVRISEFSPATAGVTSLIWHPGGAQHGQSGN